MTYRYRVVKTGWFNYRAEYRRVGSTFDWDLLDTCLTEGGAMRRCESHAATMQCIHGTLPLRPEGEVVREWEEVIL